MVALINANPEWGLLDVPPPWLPLIDRASFCCPDLEKYLVTHCYHMDLKKKRNEITTDDRPTTTDDLSISQTGLTMT